MHASLFNELYGAQPQAIVWLYPVREEQEGITDFAYVYANEEGLRFLNLSAEQLDGLLVSKSPTLTEELRVKIFSDLLHVLECDDWSETSMYNAALNKYVRVLRTPLRGGVLCIVQDVSEEQQMIRQLEEQKSLLDNILAYSSNGISVSEMIRDENGAVVDARTILANDAAVQHIGIPKEAYLARTATELEPNILSSPYYRACLQTLESGVPFVMPYFVESSGRWIEISVSRMDANRLIHIFTDVTSVREVQLQLEKTAAMLQTVFDAAQTSMFTAKPERNAAGEVTDFRFVLVNATMASYVKQRPESLKGSLASEWFPGYMTNGVFDMYKTCMETGEPTRKEVHYHVDSLDIYLDLQCVRIDDQLLVTFSDYTPLRKSQQALEQSVKALERSNASLEDFAYAASHDMKEPLRKITTFADRLKNAVSERMSDQEKGMLERIESAAHRMRLLVDDLLAYAHVTEAPGDAEPVALADKVQRVLGDLELEIEEKGARFHIGMLPVVPGNRRQLQQLFQNLIGNALKYHKPGVAPEITISARVASATEVTQHLPGTSADRAYQLIEVSDNGIGFEAGHAEQIFKIFQRLHGQAEYSGTGVGLAIVRKIVENHCGAIWAESKPGEGAHFCLLLPTDPN